MEKRISNKVELKNQNHNIKIEYLKIQLDIMNKIISNKKEGRK